jgi:hypothetical protein
MDRTKKKEIDGIQFSVAPFMVLEALKLKASLVKTFGPALGQAIGSFESVGAAKKSIGDLAIDGKAFSGAIEKLTGVLNEAQFIALLKRLFELVGATYTDKAGKQRHIQFGGGNFEAAMEEVFAGKLFTIYPVILLVLEANYPDFFGRVVRVIGRRIAAITTSAPAEPSGIEPLPASENSAG